MQEWMCLYCGVTSYGWAGYAEWVASQEISLCPNCGAKACVPKIMWKKEEKKGVSIRY